MQDTESPPPAMPEKLTKIPGRWGTVLMWLVWAVLGFLVGSGLVYCVFSNVFDSHYELRRRINCTANLRDIGTAVVLYAADHNDVYPPDLKALVDTELISPRMLTCPSSGTYTAGSNERGELESHCDYIYIAGMSEEAPGELALAYELPINHRQACANVLFTSFAVCPINDLSEFTALVQKSNEYLAENRGDE